MSDDGGLDKTHIRSTDPGTGEVRLPAPRIEKGANFGRYVILDAVASGGMGEVYAAWDPNLDRKVALKILRAEIHRDLGASQGRARLLREAQAMARLSHPNIVAVHDVDTSVDGEVFVAMEFLDGKPLREWLAETKRPWSQVLAAFIDAGKGLAAAHHAGLVHRDFKPMNVFVTKTGRVCVLDFGIARAVDGSADIAAQPARPSSSTSQPVELLTLAGSVMGTPGYMSPEQYRGEPVDARTDQFSFCVALYEGLYGLRPVVGNTLEELKRSAESGELPLPPEDTDAPDWLLPILRRGMAAKPTDRFESMDALLEALSSSPREHRRRRIRRLALVGAAACIVASLGIVKIARPEPCPRAESRWKDVWDRDRKAAVKAAFDATNRPFAAAAFAEVDRLLTAYESSWLNEHHEACVATRVRQEQSTELFDRRMVCLNRRIAEVQALSKLFLAADGDVVANAVQAVGSVPPVSACNVEAVLTSSVRAPEPSAAADVATLRAELVSVNALIESGRHSAAREALKGLEAQAKRTGYGPIIGEVSLQHARIDEVAGDLKSAIPRAHDAAVAAEEWNDAELLFRAWTLLARLEGFGFSRPEPGRLYGKYAAAALARTARTPALEADLESALGLVEREAANYDAAIAHELKAVELLTRAFGPQHPRVGLALQGLAWSQSWNGDQKTATANSRAALEILRASVGNSHPAVAKVLSELGSIEDEDGNFDEAVLHQEEGLRIREEVYGADHLELASGLNNISLTYMRVNRLDDAFYCAQRALAIYAATIGPSRRTANVMHTLGEILLARNELQPALKMFLDAQTMMSATTPSGGATDAYILTAAGETYLRLGQPKLALPLLENALKDRESGDDQLPFEVGRTRSALARALLATGDQGRAHQLAKLARESFKAAGRRAEPELLRLVAAFPELGER